MSQDAEASCGKLANACWASSLLLQTNPLSASIICVPFSPEQAKSGQRVPGCVGVVRYYNKQTPPRIYFCVPFPSGQSKKTP